MQRRGEFIWTPDQPIAELAFRQLIGDGPVRRDCGSNRWLMFRKRVSIDKLPEYAAIDITVDGAYLLFVNGQRVGRGPTRSAPDHKLFDRHEVAPLLVTGDNVIAVLVHVYGIDTAWYETSKEYWQTIFGDGGLYCVGHTGPTRDDVLFTSDTSWRCAEAGAWNRETPRSGWGQDFIEDYDARREATDWTTVTFDDGDWSRAQLLVDERDAIDHAKGFGTIRAFPVLSPSGIPPMAESVIAPSGIVGTFGLVPDPGLPIDERLYSEALCELPGDNIEQIDALLHDDDTSATIRTAADCDVGILVQFDTLQTGYPFIELEAEGDEIVEVAVAERHDSESARDNASSPRIAKTSFLDVAHIFRYTARAGTQYFEKFEWTSSLYLQVVVRNASSGLKIRRIGIRACHYPAEQPGRFECSDDFLNELWTTARHTVLQCSHDAWEDCPGREKRQWVGDGVSRYPVSAAAFGTSMQPLDRLFLLQVARSQRNDGLVQMYAPGDHKTSGIVIPDYTLHFVMIAHEYLMHTGDIETVGRIWPALSKGLSWFENFRDSNGLLIDLPHWHFIEWADVGRHGAAACINVLHAAAVRAAASLARALDYPRDAKQFDSAYHRQRDALNKLLWDEGRGVYVDNVDPQSGEQAQQVSQQANALALLYDIAPADRRERIIAYITDPTRTKLTAVPPVVPVGEDIDPAHDVVRCNSFFSHFLYSALGRCGRTDLALQSIRDHYAPMLAAGTGTLWESFDATASLCHAFSATPLYQLSAFVLGVRPTGIGFRSFVVAPQFCDLNVAKGAYPTPAGPIDVEWRREDEKVMFCIGVPDGIAGEFVLPPGFHLVDGPVALSPGIHDFSIQRGDPID